MEMENMNLDFSIFKRRIRMFILIYVISCLSIGDKVYVFRFLILGNGGRNNKRESTPFI